MKRIRRIIFWCHLTAGVFAGIVILVMSVTGVLLAYERQITYWADTRGYNVARPSPSSGRLPPEALLAKVRESQTAFPSALTVRTDPEAPAQVSFGRERTLYVNPYTGEGLGEGAPGVRAFFRKVTDWHRWLGAEGESRAVGRAVTGACNLAFLFIVGSGVYLWWPRKWSRSAVRGVTWFRRGLRGPARDFNWHNTLGFWSAIPLFVVVLSSVVISYTWAGNLVYRLAGEEPPAPRSSAPPGAPAGNAAQQRQEGAKAGEASLDRLNLMWARAEQQVEGWQSISLQLPPKPDAPVTFTIDRGNGGQPQKRAQLTLDRKSGEVVRWEPFSSSSTGRRLRSYLRFAHTGEVAGVVGQTVAGLASVGAVVLVLTGLSLAWRRFRAWAAKRLAGASSAVGQAEPALGLRDEQAEALESTVR
ncbi:MAG: PepSY domain-containing protein [Acidobacteria bacterium]|nr:PepSY domain-containing protein [Acidobacteriota bacterium]